MAALAEVTFAGATCDSVLPALVLEFEPVELLCKTFDALVAAFELVTLFDMFHSYKGCCREGIVHVDCNSLSLFFYTVKCLFVQVPATGTSDSSIKTIITIWQPYPGQGMAKSRLSRHSYCQTATLLLIFYQL